MSKGASHTPSPAFFAHAVEHAPPHLRYLLLHHPCGEAMQAVVAGLKPTVAVVDGMHPRELASFLNRVARRKLFFSSPRYMGVLGNTHWVQDIIRRHSEHFRENSEVSLAAKENRPPHPVKVFEDPTHPTVGLGLLLGYPLSSVLAHDPKRSVTHPAGFKGTHQRAREGGVLSYRLASPYYGGYFHYIRTDEDSEEFERMHEKLAHSGLPQLVDKLRQRYPAPRERRHSLHPIDAFIEVYEEIRKRRNTR